MRSPVNWALLGLVIQRPSYGYELVHRFERAYGGLIELSSQSQIYKALDALEGRCFVKIRHARDAAASRQPRLRYHATDEGLRCYQEWLVAQVEHERSRSRLLAGQLAMLPADRAVAVLDRFERVCLEGASGTPVGAAGRARSSERGASDISERLTVEDERLTLDARLMWIQYARLQFSSPPAARKTRAR
jgi:DNA-binding PadR family transcriptional regulator